jgi:hypothetical protein
MGGSKSGVRVNNGPLSPPSSRSRCETSNFFRVAFSDLQIIRFQRLCKVRGGNMGTRVQTVVSSHQTCSRTLVLSQSYVSWLISWWSESRQDQGSCSPNPIAVTFQLPWSIKLLATDQMTIIRFPTGEIIFLYKPSTNNFHCCYWLSTVKLQQEDNWPFRP